MDSQGTGGAWILWAYYGDAVLKSLRDGAIGLLLGFMLATVSVLTCHDRQVEALKVYADSVTTAATHYVARVDRFADSLVVLVDSLQTHKDTLVVAAVADTMAAAELELSLADQKTTADSNVVLRAENRALRRANVNLWTALNIANAQLAASMTRGDSLGKALAIVTADLRAVNARVQGLTPAPKWFRISFEIMKVGAAFYAGVKYAER